jgi:hypothetical protein
MKFVGNPYDIYAAIYVIIRDRLLLLVHLLRLAFLTKSWCYAIEDHA